MALCPLPLEPHPASTNPYPALLAPPREPLQVCRHDSAVVAISKGRRRASGRR